MSVSGRGWIRGGVTEERAEEGSAGKKARREGEREGGMERWGGRVG